MALSSKTTNDLLQIISSGASLRFNASGKTTRDLQMLASAAKSKGVSVTFIGLTKTTSDMMSIASSGGGHVCFADE